MGAESKRKLSRYYRYQNPERNIWTGHNGNMIGKRVQILDIAECHPYWHDRHGTVVDTVEDDGRFYWEVHIDDHVVPVPFVEHEMEIL